MAVIGLSGLTRSLAHAGRLARLGEKLGERGHKIVYFGAPGWFGDPAILKNRVNDVRVLPEPYLAAAISGARGERGPDEVDLFSEALEQDRAALGDDPVDLVVVDNRRSMNVAAELARIPVVSLTNAQLLGSRCAFEPTVDEIYDILLPSRGQWPPLASVHRGPSPSTTTQALQSVPLDARILERIGRAGGRMRPTVDSLCLGDRTVVLDPPSVLPTRNLPLYAIQPGPIFPRLHVDLPEWWPELDPDRPVVYLTFGATGRAQDLREVIDALAQTQAQVVISTGDLTAVPEGAFGARLMPADPVFERADLVVCHGGTLTVYHALSHGTPVITMPTHMEQAVSTAALARTGAVWSLPRMACAAEPERLIELVARALASPELSEAARVLRALFDGERAVLRTAAACEALLR